MTSNDRNDFDNNWNESRSNPRVNQKKNPFGPRDNSGRADAVAVQHQNSQPNNAYNGQATQLNPQYSTGMPHQGNSNLPPTQANPVVNDPTRVHQPGWQEQQQNANQDTQYDYGQPDDFRPGGFSPTNYSNIDGGYGGQNSPGFDQNTGYQMDFNPQDPNAIPYQDEFVDEQGYVPIDPNDPNYGQYPQPGVPQESSSNVPKFAIFGGLALLAIIGIITFLILSGSDDDSETSASTTASTIADTNSTQNQDSAANQPAVVSLRVSQTKCQGDRCDVTGPLDATAEDAYQVVVENADPSEVTVEIDGEKLANSTDTFDFVGKPGRHTIKVSVKDAEEPVTFDQYAFDNKPGYGVLLSEVNRVEPGFGAAIVEYDSLVANNPDAILTESIYFADFDPSNYIIYVGGFDDEAKANEYCTSKGLTGDKCNVKKFGPSS